MSKNSRIKKSKFINMMKVSLINVILIQSKIQIEPLENNIRSSFPKVF